MRFSTVAIVGALAALASAQNPFTRTNYEGIAAGQPEDITWEPTSKGTVTLKLVQGDPKDLTQVQNIATGIINDGSYSWTPATTLPRGTDYALQIVDDLDPNAKPNYTQLFSIESDVEAEPSSSSATSTATTTVASSTVTETSSATLTKTTDSETSSEASSTKVITSTNTETTTTGTESSSTGTATTMESSTRRTSSRASSTAAATTTTPVTGAAATGGAKIGAGLVGFVGAAVLLF